MTDRLSLIFSALADPTRRAILARLAEGEATVTELAEPFDISLPAISRHLKVLEKAGLISRSRLAQWRSSRLEAEPLRAATARVGPLPRAAGWPQGPPGGREAEPLREATAWMERYRRLWDVNFPRLDAHLKRLK